MRAKVAAYITVYKDKEAADTCIQAIQEQSTQVDTIFIVDNSPKKLFDFAQDYDGFIKVHHYPTNIGVSQGILLALEWATRQGYDFLWAFDQDSVVNRDCLEILLTAYNELSVDGYKIGIIGATPIDPRNNQLIEGAVFNRDRFVGCKPSNQFHTYECDSPITSGSLIAIAAAKTVSPPRAELFMDGIDLDYGLRLRQKGFHNLIVPQAIMYHNFGEPIKVKFFQRELSRQKYSALRHYYICRNHTYLATRYAQGWYRITSCLRRIKYLISTISLILLYDSEDKSLKVWGCLLGTFHGFHGTLGKIWQ